MLEDDLAAAAGIARIPEPCSDFVKTFGIIRPDVVFKHRMLIVVNVHWNLLQQIELFILHESRNVLQMRDQFTVVCVLCQFADGVEVSFGDVRFLLCDRIVAVEFMMISALLYINLSLPAFASLTAMSPMSWLMFCRVDFRNNICMQTPPDICFSRIMPLNEQAFKEKGLYFNDFLAKCRALVLMRFLTIFEA